MSNAPYISWLGHGAASLAPPGVFTGATAHFFLIDASTTAMQGLADRLLNPAGGGAVRYEAILPLSMLSFYDVERCTSATDIVGWLPGRECAIWVPLLEIHPGHPLRTRLVFWSPYIFIDYTIGLLTGREAWGWPKVLAKIGVASDTPAAPEFSCETTYFLTMAAGTRGVNGVLYRVVQEQAAAHQPPAWQSAAEALEGMIGGFLVGDPLYALHIQPRVPTVVLKQFRATGEPERACFQSIVDSPVEVTRFGGGGPLLDTFSLEIATCESHTIVRDILGRAPDPGSTKLPVKFAAWVAMDFQALAGSDIVVST